MKGFSMVMTHLFLFYNASLLGVLFFFLSFLWAGACMIQDGWRRKGFHICTIVLLLGRLVRVHGVTSDVLTFNSLIIEKE